MGRAIAVSRRRGGSGWCVKESWWRPVIAVTGERRLKTCSYCTFNSDRMLINTHSLHSHCTHVGVKPDWIQIHLNPLREVVSIWVEVNPV